MELSTALHIALWVCGFAVAGYVRIVQAELNTLKHDLKNANQALSNLRELIPERYATTLALRETMKEVREALQRIEDKIDKKADK